jgi:hypothetical protein
MDTRVLDLRGVGRTATGEEEASSAITVIVVVVAVAALRDALRSFWRRFWNHIVTTLCSRSSSRASASRSSREGWEVRWKSCSSMVSWEPVKRLRERFVVGWLGGVLRRGSSEEEVEEVEPRLEEDSERKRLGLIGAMERRGKRSHNGFIQGDPTGRDAPVNVETRSLSRDRV